MTDDEPKPQVNAVYQTLWGDRFDLPSLPSSQAVLIRDVLQRYDSSKRPEEYDTQCRQALSMKTVDDGEYSELLAGPVGQVYLDCWHRLRLRPLDASAREAAVARIRSDPSRVIHDWSVTGRWRTQTAFAHATGTKKSQISLLTSRFGSPGEREDEENPLGLEAIKEAARRLRISFSLRRIADVEADAGADSPWVEDSPAEPSERELELAEVLVQAILQPTTDDRKRFLVQELGRLYRQRETVARAIAMLFLARLESVPCPEYQSQAEANDGPDPSDRLNVASPASRAYIH